MSPCVGAGCPLSPPPGELFLLLCAMPQPWPGLGFSSRQALWSALGHCHRDKSFQHRVDLSQSRLAVAGMVPLSPPVVWQVTGQGQREAVPIVQNSSSPHLSPADTPGSRPEPCWEAGTAFTAGRLRLRQVKDRVMLSWFHFRGDRRLKRDCPDPAVQGRARQRE